MFRVGDRVQTRQKFHKRRRIGVITEIDGALHYVKLGYRLNQYSGLLIYTVELYPCEIKKARRLRY